MIRFLLAWTVAFLVAVPEPQVTAADVVAMMAAVPTRGGAFPGHYDRARDAVRIAVGIAAAVNDEQETVLDDRRSDAALLAVFAAYESANHSCASGDRGASLGFLQIQGVRASIACDPTAASREWLWRARVAMRTCVESPPEERLALLASGRCSRARQLSRDRVELARRISEGAQ